MADEKRLENAQFFFTAPRLVVGYVSDEELLESNVMVTLHGRELRVRASAGIFYVVDRCVRDLA